MQESVKQDREKYIGGSDIPIIMELSPFKSRFDLLLEKAGYKKDTFEGNVFTEYGNTMESKIRDYINKEKGSHFAEGKHIVDVPVEWNEHPNGMKIRAHTDGECGNIILEVKTTTQIYDDVNDYDYYLVQLLFYMMVTGCQFGLLAVYERPEDMDETFHAENLQTYIINIDDYAGMVSDIKTAVSRFLDDLQKVKSNAFITEEELLPSDITEISKRIIAFEQQIARMKQLEKTIKAEKDRLKTAMETAGVKHWETPSGYKITLVADKDDTTATETTFNAERFMAEHPELVETYMETKTVIKKGKKGYVLITPPKEEKS